jgi:hypothetical protein
LSGGVQGGLFGRQVGAEVLVVEVLVDVDVGGAVGQRDLVEVLAEGGTGELAGQVGDVLALVRGEAGDVDESLDIAVAAGGVGDDRAAVGVSGEHDGPFDAGEQVRNRGGVAGEGAQRVGGGDDAMTGGVEPSDDAVPARGAGESAVDENDGGLHGDVPPVSGSGAVVVSCCRQDGSTLSSATDRGISHPTPVPRADARRMRSFDLPPDLLDRLRAHETFRSFAGRRSSAAGDGLQAHPGAGARRPDR